MPTASSTCFSITFRPTFDEFNKYHEDFMDKIEKNYDKYIFCYEKGSGDEINHLQGFMEFNKEKVANNFRKEFDRKIMKDFNIGHPKVALKITPIKRDVNVCIGYVLKEQSDLSTILQCGFDNETLQKLQKDYLEVMKEKKMKSDKQRISLRNIHVLMEEYIKIKQIDIVEIEEKDVRRILGLMGNDGYCLLPLTQRGFSHTVRYLTAYFNTGLEDYFKNLA